MKKQFQLEDDRVDEAGRLGVTPSYHNLQEVVKKDEILKMMKKGPYSCSDVFMLTVTQFMRQS